MIKKLLCIFASAMLIFNITAFAETKNPYKVEVNRAQNYVSVYAPDDNGEYTRNVKNFICSTGPDTPDGTFSTSNKYTWRYLFGDVYGQYATRITGHILFHSVPYYTQNKNDLEYEEYNKLGTSASMGCIRLTVEDAKWIYDNCPSGTTVKIFYDETSAVPQYKQPLKIDVNDTAKRGWDPTDPDINNPWKKIENKVQYSAPITAVLSNNTYHINKSTKTIKCCIVNNETYIHIKDTGKFFDGILLAKENGSTFEFKKFENRSFISRSIFTTDFKTYPVESKVIYLKFNNALYPLNCYNINGYNFIRLEDAARVFGADISVSDGKTYITY